ncbi:Phenylpyruvate tautomerase PptA, 4-oxalocrotonate tautomerase family [Caloramator quimbayensis]|uniref:L-dopachrome isomerase n=1 Tax=Caloramator quimbayensis TaxID=1147123 RepID=A0A1T4YD93_9CLOT|nr:phenylpyruvate tautomerase MIF-related protein [Caloramator quimbayensis]SKA99653.1 Phenylpyruvate tautomerase PptA, 4-oxalocrotonate tautomerase family [Caloramator quimbayensis]
MPYINNTVSMKLTLEQEEYIKSQLGKIISEIPNKTEQWLMVSFSDDKVMYFGGERKTKVAYIDIRLLGSCSREHKNKIANLITELFNDYLEIPNDCIYITFQEFKDWAWNGSLF